MPVRIREEIQEVSRSRNDSVRGIYSFQGSAANLGILPRLAGVVFDNRIWDGGSFYEKLPNAWGLVVAAAAASAAIAASAAARTASATTAASVPAAASSATAPVTSTAAARAIRTIAAGVHGFAVGVFAIEVRLFFLSEVAATFKGDGLF